MGVGTFPLLDGGFDALGGGAHAPAEGCVGSSDWVGGDQLSGLVDGRHDVAAEVLHGEGEAEEGSEDGGKGFDGLLHVFNGEGVGGLAEVGVDANLGIRVGCAGVGLCTGTEREDAVEVELEVEPVRHFHVGHHEVLGLKEFVDDGGGGGEGGQRTCITLFDLLNYFKPRHALTSVREGAKVDEGAGAGKAFRGGERLLVDGAELFGEVLGAAVDGVSKSVNYFRGLGAGLQSIG